MAEEVKGIVLDIGSYNTRAGFAGDDAPRAVFPSVVGDPKYNLAMVGMGAKSFYVGDEAESMRGRLKLCRPVKHGRIENFDYWERLLHHAYFNELRVEPESHPVIFSVPLQSPHEYEQRYAQELFEIFDVPALAGVRAPVLSLYASGRGSGIVVEIGHGLTQIVPIWQGVIIDEATVVSKLAGSAITDYLATLTTQTSNHLVSPASADLLFDIDKMKRNCCYVASDFETEMTDYQCSAQKYKDWTFSDGRVHTLCNERILAPEVLFKPKLGGHESLSITQLIFKSIMLSPMDIRRDLYTNIILSGATTLTPGLPERIEAELKALIPQGMVCKVVAPPERAYSTWIGGSIVGSLSTWTSRLYTKAQYDEDGPMHIRSFGCLATQRY